MPRFKNGSDVVIRRGIAEGKGVKNQDGTKPDIYNGDVGGARGRLLGTEIRESDGVEMATVAVTDTARGSRAKTGLLDVPVSRLRHAGFRGLPAVAADGVRRIMGSGAGPSRVLHGNVPVSSAPQPVPVSPFADLVAGGK